MASAKAMTYLTQEEAVKLDEELMGPLGFSVDQLMELAGLSVACALAAETPASSRVLVLAGPGNNGGDGLVAARHLHHFGYKVDICYPKATDKALYHGLVTQCRALRMPFLSPESLPKRAMSDKYDVVLDALFGFSFRGPPRAPFDALLLLVSHQSSGCFVASVDIPSGWHVEKGDEEGDGLRPDMLVSLTTPKNAARFFTGAHHYLGGRFVPPEISEKFSLQLPEYPGTAMCVKLAAGIEGVADMRRSDSLLQGSLDESTVLKDPFEQFARWFEEAAAVPGVVEANAMSLATVSADGAPSNRMVLLKGYSSDGFVFYTNHGSRKGRELDESKRAALCFFWEPLGRSVRVEGRVEQVAEEESTRYFHSRPRGSQIGAWCSAQSSIISGREELEGRLAELNQQYSDATQQIPKPPFWGGYRVVPICIEFWHSRKNRLHDRLRFSRLREDEEWSLERLSP